MSRWRDLARKLRDEGGGDDRDDRDVRGEQPAIVPIVPNVLGGGSLPAPVSVRADPSGWIAALTQLDANHPHGGMELDRWCTLLADARWIARNHGEAAAAFGWCASDLFGLDPVRDGWGGLADRLNGARRLAFTATLAHWQGDGCEGWLWRGTLTAKSLIWERQAGAV